MAAPAFDPDAYLAAPVAFDPDAYLAAPKVSDIPAERRPPTTMAVVTSAPYKALGGAAMYYLTHRKT